jgi:4-amino-4-deoxy-L-arabinose transferase-like glycosyltransferase
VGGYLATRAVTGEHEYAFSFSSPTFNLGLVVSGLTLIVVFLAVVRDPVLTARTRAALASARSHLRTGGRELAIAAARRLDRVRQGVARASRLLGAATARLTDLQTRVVAVADRKGTQLSLLLFALALCVYLATRLIRLQDFPIYFFTDEAVQTVLASDFARDGFHDSNGVAWPTYFENSSLYNLSLSVYLQVLPAMLLPRSVFVTRAIPALVTLGAAMALALILKDIFRARTWWAGPLLLAVVPTWFLHSRTAFETTLMVSFYAWFLYFYLRYRQGSPRHLYPALLCGGLAFYSYSPGQLVVVATGLLLLLFDFRYHWAHRRAAVGGGLLLALLALPYVRFQQQHPGETYFHLRMVGSHWFVDLPWLEKLGQSIQLYLQGLDPGYWFFPHERELMRHSMHGYAFIPTAMLPLVILALVRGPRLWSAGSVRALLLAALAVPVGAAMAGLGITRVLAFVIPVTALAALGLEALATPIRPLLARRAAGLGLVAGLSLASFGMLSDAVTHGPTWYDDYGLYGMQFGARQVFGEVRAALARTPAARVVLSPIWANGTDVLLRYFLPGESRIILQGGVSLIENPVEDLEESIYVLTPEEFQAVRESPFFGQILLLKILPYPDGRPGFYFLSLRYAPDAQERFARQLELRRQPVTEDVQVDGEWITVQHSPFDLGDLKEIFDGDPFTVTRTRESNPAVLALTFRTPRPMSGLSLSVSTMELTLRARVQTVSEGEGPQTFVWEYSDLPNDPTVEAQFWETPRLVQSLTLEIENRGGLPLDKIHIIDLILR